MSTKITVLVHTGNRSDFGLVSPVIKALENDSAFEVAVFENYQVGTSLVDMAQGVAHSIIDTIDTYLAYNKVDIVLLVGDRYEALGFAIAAYYMNIPIAHIFGGDRSVGGNLDDSVRHAITKLSHIHFATNADSYNRVLLLGEEEERVYNVGSPVIDAVVNKDFCTPEEVEEQLELDRNEKIIVFTQHPITTEVDLVDRQLLPSLEALKVLQYKTVITYPNMDAGSNDIIRLIKRYENLPNFCVHNNLGHKMYLGLLNIADVVVGNSSSGILETPAFNLPAIDVGPRQEGRMRACNVISTGYNKDEIIAAIVKCFVDEEFKRNIELGHNPYGNGTACEQIVQVLKSTELNRKLLQKRITY